MPAFLTDAERRALEVALPGWLPAQRWFATKDRPILGVHLVAAFSLGEGHAYVLVHVERPEERAADTPFVGAPRATATGTDLYALPLSRGRDAEIGASGLSDGAAVPDWWRAFAAAWRLDGTWEPNALADGPFDVRMSKLGFSEDGPGWALADVCAAPQEVRLVGQDASNASALVQVTARRGGRPFASVPIPGVPDEAWLFVKVLRRIVHAPSLEADRLSVLDHDFWSGHAPALLGVATLGLRSQHAHRPDVALVMNGYPDARDAWSAMLDVVRAGDEPAVQDLSARLGKAVAALHLSLEGAYGALGRSPESHGYEPTFGREQMRPLVDDLWAAWRLRYGVDGLAPGDDAAWAPAEAAADIVGRLGAGAFPANALMGKRIWIHGDLHLGQVLVLADGSLRVIDFEGEPARTAEERTHPDSPLRDVAGMLRSFDYAVATAAPEADRDRLCSLAETAFLDAYRAHVAAVSPGTSDLWPDDTAFGPLLRLYLVQKALYEVQYERAYRPDRAWIPEAALARLLAEA